ncbi:hypothetical protein N657DRAFT_102073 [Parathielavia appendiculata]|uniref:Uncharacterized protein n=1 Tax=Parathielavia appendiculata TaxID=2587402 RepID=A0AAN6Z1W8_9PEZI|nr:hypothetical protein N657DRAFT_102073 [Parathielavia appendiculata]
MSHRCPPISVSLIHSMSANSSARVPCYDGNATASMAKKQNKTKRWRSDTKHVIWMVENCKSKIPNVPRIPMHQPTESQQHLLPKRTEISEQTFAYSTSMIPSHVPVTTVSPRSRSPKPATTVGNTTQHPPPLPPNPGHSPGTLHLTPHAVPS